MAGQDDLTVGELGRVIDALRQEFRDGMTALNARLDRVVSTDVYNLQSAHTATRIADLAADVEKVSVAGKALEDAFEAYKVAEAERRERDRQARFYSAIIPIILALVATGATVWVAVAMQ